METQIHLRRGFFYVLRNDKDPRKRWTNVPELLGARLQVGSTCARVRQLLPDVHVQDIWRELEVGKPGPPVGGHRLREAAVEAICGPLRTKTPDAVGLRRAAARVGLDLGMTRSAVAAQLDLTSKSVGRMAILAEPALVHAIRTQVGLLDALGSASVTRRTG
ncbi:MAG: hypothetical protein GY913_22565 [Proteobacteria bacterium]|nr:hypothetical protein [Pseudomonadota bacterium]MCP4919694.1 hypothetical protein [Pseudomonadota bacterium]